MIFTELFTLDGPDDKMQDWDGQIYADFSQVDLSHLQQHANLGVTLSQGRGALRVWGEVARGQVVAATADAALTRVDTRLGSDLAALELEQELFLQMELLH